MEQINLSSRVQHFTPIYSFRTYLYIYLLLGPINLFIPHLIIYLKFLRWHVFQKLMSIID